MPNQKRPLIIFLSLALLFVALFPVRNPSAFAQGKRQRGRRPAAKKVAERPKLAPVETRQLPEFISGEKVVNITGTTKTTFDIGLAKYGVCLIEYTDTDVVYKVHPGDERMVTVDRTSKGRDPIVLRPGKLFLVPENDAEPVPISIVTIQMGSGAIFSFRVFPVSSAAQNANRVVLAYNRDDVVRERVRAGLPVNFKASLPPSSEPLEAAAQTAPPPAPPGDESVASVAAQVQAQAAPSPTPVVVTSPAQSQPTPVNTAQRTSAQAAPAYVPTVAQLPAPQAEQPRERPAARPSAGVVKTAAAQPAPSRVVVSSPPAASSPLSSNLREKLKQAVAANNFSRFSRASHGLAVAVGAPAELDADTEYVVLAVRNTLKAQIRLLPEQPELTIETLDRKRRPILTGDPVNVKGVESTIPVGLVLAPGATAYFIVAYAPPVLGANQYLRVSVGQTLAADEPSIVDLSITSR